MGVVFTSDFLALPMPSISLEEGIESALWDTMRHMSDSKVRGREVNDAEAQDVETLLRNKLSEDKPFAEQFASCASVAECWAWLTDVDSGIEDQLIDIRNQSQDRDYAHKRETTARLSKRLSKLTEAGTTYRNLWPDMKTSSEFANPSVDHGTVCIDNLEETVREVKNLRDYLHQLPLDASQWTWRKSTRRDYLETQAALMAKLGRAPSTEYPLDQDTQVQLANLHHAFQELIASPMTAVQGEEGSNPLWNEKACSDIEMAISTLKGKHRKRLPSSLESRSSGRQPRGRIEKHRSRRSARPGGSDRSSEWRDSARRHQESCGDELE